MSQTGRTLADEVIRLVEINRTTINGLTYGDVIFKIHQGRIVEVTVVETLKISTGSMLHAVALKTERE